MFFFRGFAEHQEFVHVRQDLGPFHWSEHSINISAEDCAGCFETHWHPSVLHEAVWRLEGSVFFGVFGKRN